MLVVEEEEDGVESEEEDKMDMDVRFWKQGRLRRKSILSW